MDFTFNTLRRLLTALHDSGYLFLSVKEFSESKIGHSGKLIILRHDVDKKPANSLATANLESELGIHGTYYFRIRPESFDRGIIKEIALLGHEIGYHYEDLRMASQKAKVKRRKSISFVRTSEDKKGERQKANDKSEEELAATAIEIFTGNLEKLRKIASIDTICMHGSPMSRYDSRLIWKYYDYRELGINVEPYFDFSLDDMLYLTDTGRKWNGSAVSIRDRAYVRNEGYYSDWVREPVIGSAMAITEQGEALQKRFSFRNTDDILQAAMSKELPERMLITIHPQRWSKSFSEWMTELLIQNIKNPAKFLVNRYNLA